MENTIGTELIVSYWSRTGEGETVVQSHAPLSPGEIVSLGAHIPCVTTRLPLPRILFPVVIAGIGVVHSEACVAPYLRKARQHRPQKLSLWASIAAALARPSTGDPLTCVALI